MRKILILLFFIFSFSYADNQKLEYNENIIIFGLPIFFVSLAVDNDVQSFVQNNKNEMLDTATDIFNLAGSKFAYFIPFATGSFAKYKKDKKLFEASKTAFSASVISTLAVATLKFSINRERPDKSDKNSFPSNHTALAFAIFGSYAHYYTNTTTKIILYTIPTLTAFSRIYKNKHYLSDTVGGGIIGLSSVYLGKYLSEKFLYRIRLETNVNKNYFSFNLKYNF